MKDSPIDIKKDIILEAAAGTGKTFQLSVRVAIMLLLEAQPKDILALTFTNKAVDEMGERILNLMKCLKEGATDSISAQHEKIRAYLEAYLKEKKIERDVDDFLKERAEKAYDSLIEHYTDLQVQTIDAFSKSIISLFPYEAGIRPNFEIISEVENEALKVETFNEMMKNILNAESSSNDESFKNLLLDFHKFSSYSEVDSFASFLKDSVIKVSDNIVILRESIRKSWEIEELYEKVKENIDRVENKIIAKLPTLTAIIFEIDNYTKKKDELKKAGEEVIDGRTLNPKKKYIPKIMSYKNILDFSSDEFCDFPEKIDTLNLSAYFEIRNEVEQYYALEKDIYANICLILGERLHKLLEKRKFELNSLSFADITQKSFDLLAGEEADSRVIKFSGGKYDTSYFYFRLDSKVKHLLMDEFQDTSALQWAILKPIAEEIMDGIGQKDAKGSFFYVGDPKQTIYRFRDPVSNLFNKVALEYTSENTRFEMKRLQLEENFRSGENIVTFVNDLYASIRDCKDIFPTDAKMKYDDYKDKIAELFTIDQKAKNTEGYVYIEEGKASSRGNDHLLSRVEFAIAAIKKARAEGFDNKDIAIIAEDRNTLFNVASELERLRNEEGADYEYILEASRKLAYTDIFLMLYNLAIFLETKEIYNFLLFSTIASDKGYSYGEALSNYERAKKVASELECMQLSISCKVLRAVELFFLRERCSDTPDFYQTLELFIKVCPYESNVELFKEQVMKAAREVDAISTNTKNAITLITVHKSKGLEYPCVIIPKLDRKFVPEVNKGKLRISSESDSISQAFLLPIYNKNITEYIRNADSDYDNKYKSESISTLIDQLNLLYVALTRAKVALFIYAAPPSTDNKYTVASSLLHLLKTGEAKISAESNFGLKNCIYEKGDFSASAKLFLEAKSASEKEVIKSSSESSSGYLDSVIISEQPLSEAVREFTGEFADNFESLQFGSALHLGLFYLDPNKSSSLQSAINEVKAAYSLFLKTERLKEVEEYLTLILKEEQWANLFKSRVFKERQIQVDGKSSIIDFYAINGNEIILLDYKTGNISTENMKKYEAQLKRYEEGLKNIYGQSVAIKKNIVHFHKKKIDFKSII